MAVASGVGNFVSTSPFINPANADYRIRGNSAAYNVGDNSVWASYVEPVDLLGNPRIRFRIVDLGCYESTISLGTSIVIR